MVAAALLSSRARQWFYYSPLYYYPLSKAGVALYSPLAHHSGNGSGGGGFTPSRFGVVAAAAVGPTTLLIRRWLSLWRRLNSPLSHATVGMAALALVVMVAILSRDSLSLRLCWW